jgi:hypothetical protein
MSSKEIYPRLLNCSITGIVPRIKLCFSNLPTFYYFQTLFTRNNNPLSDFKHFYKAKRSILIKNLIIKKQVEI